MFHPLEEKLFEYRRVPRYIDSTLRLTLALASHRVNDFFYVFTGRFSQLTGNITIVRDIEETVFRIYVPSILVVLMSLVGFWIDNEDAIDRITLSVTTILTITTMNEGVREGIPKVKIECLSS